MGIAIYRFFCLAALVICACALSHFIPKSISCDGRMELVVLVIPQCSPAHHRQKCVTLKEIIAAAFDMVDFFHTRKTAIL
jgi:hypothetical protein